MAQGDKLRAGSAGEVIEVDAAVHPAVGAADGRAHRVDPVFAVRVGVDDLAGELDQLDVLRGEFTARDVHDLNSSDGAALPGPEAGTLKIGGSAARLLSVARYTPGNYPNS